MINAGLELAVDRVWGSGSEAGVKDKMFCDGEPTGDAASRLILINVKNFCANDDEYAQIKNSTKFLCE